MVLDCVVSADEFIEFIDSVCSAAVAAVAIIAKIDNITVFVEVKCRQSAMFGLPREAVTPFKQRKIRQVATQYLKNHLKPIEI